MALTLPLNSHGVAAHKCGCGSPRQVPEQGEVDQAQIEAVLRHHFEENAALRVTARSSPPGHGLPICTSRAGQEGTPGAVLAADQRSLLLHRARY